MKRNDDPGDASFFCAKTQCVRASGKTFRTNQPYIAMRGGMRSGWAASRTGQLSDTASQLTFGG